MSLRITCITKKDRSSPHERIRKIGGTNNDGTRWWLTLDEAIAGIDSGRYTFHVKVAGASIGVVIAEHNRHRYLKTEVDGHSPDNLLSLPECG